jgi:hypothetical protein
MRKKWTKYTRRFHETLEYKKPMDVYQEDREFTAPTPNSKWVSDTTLLPQNLWQLFKISYIEHFKKPSSRKKMRKKWTKYTRRFHETLEYKKPMDVYQESIKLNQEEKRASWSVLYKKF